MKFDIFMIFRKFVEKIQVSLKSDEIKDTLHVAQYTFFNHIPLISS